MVLGTLLGILLVATAATADARHLHKHRGRSIDSITLTPDGRGSLISVTFAGRARPRVLHSPEPISAYALADVDDDGNLDIVTTSGGTQLLIWRNAGRGHFVLAAPSGARASRPVRSGLRPVTRVDEGPVAAEDRYDVAMPRAPAAREVDPVVAVPAFAVSLPAATPSVQWSGRAPPTLNV